MIKIAFTGDIMLARGVEQQLNLAPDNNLLSSSISNFLDEFDYVVGNLECPVSVDTPKLSSTRFKAHPHSLNQIERFHLLSLANNHIFDCGKQGAKDTIETLEENNKTFCGLLEAEGAKYYTSVNISDKRISFFSCAVQYCVKDNDRENYPKIILADDPDLIESITKSSTENNYTIILVHGGNEMIPYPEANFRNLCQSFIDAGADVVITHHPHVLGGVHRYKNKYIFYSLGDFVFDGESYLRRRGLILGVSFDNDKISFKVYPTQINKNLEIHFASAIISNKIVNRWNTISQVLQTERNYNSKYRFRYIVSLMYFQMNRLLFLLQNKGVLYMIKFTILKARLIPFYLKKIRSKSA